LCLNNSIFSRRQVITTKKVAIIWTPYLKIDINKNWLYHAINPQFGMSSILNGMKNPASKAIAFQIVDEWLVKNGWVLLEPDDPRCLLI
jgi:hypothetical protein